MSTQESHNEGPSYRSVEVGVALAIMAFGALVITGSISAGISWGAEGPRAGFFPFYIGLAIIISGAINLWNAIKPDSQGGLFAEWFQLRQVLSVVIPTTIYVASMPFIGLYVASVIFIGWFMRWLGKYSWPMVAAVALGVPLFTYIVFEKYFLVPLPKGPLEEWLNL
jgi:hypothetical protein